MKDFIERIRLAWKYGGCWDNEPWFIKCFMVTMIVPVGLAIVATYIIVGVTSPLWIIPYAIYWTRKKKNERQIN